MDGDQFSQWLSTLKPEINYTRDTEKNKKHADYAETLISQYTEMMPIDFLRFLKSTDTLKQTNHVLSQHHSISSKQRRSRITKSIN
ncbi:hypothetical protein GNI_116350 [Gregarina niphandrodes]|uniref:Uncharacterized protein n=1 Tax=Gregarina niphandrodes TaxID=110365 RepID=A0A023B2W3_GRENI|nr:hypothetical protein GNI_116350 [Gregarina niphandrodes]EZG55195.1 hypothetical protein GNI_116350 [Gregarina niphandrodes]|eukprot:XP_011131722.1 hypothetical protein GNI_116350 [Gregarina niphandrodes]